MIRKAKLALAALLGFSAACSSAKHSAGKSSEPREAIGVEVRSDTTHYRVVAMYGVRSPQGPRVIPLRPESETAADSLRTDSPAAPQQPGEE
ncbi:MAG: hypothetical protein NC209_03490 [Alistipes sp.]|nr:hypothetical protein [Alistipes senegalensis]MCM1250195.1 hypothetical protein [Alistipes sp.]